MTCLHSACCKPSQTQEASSRLGVSGSQVRGTAPGHGLLSGQRLPSNNSHVYYTCRYVLKAERVKMFKHFVNTFLA